MSSTYEPGRRYRVIFNDGTRHPKQVILPYVGQEDGKYVFDRGPLGPYRIDVPDLITAIESQMPVNPLPRKVGTF